MVSVYNEDEYLNNYEVLRMYEELGRLYLRKVRRDRIKYKNTLDCYDEFLDEVIDLLKDIGFNNELEYAIALGYLIENGYLSSDFKFKSGTAEDEIKTKFGVSIIEGVGCCRNISSFNKDVLDKMNFNNKLLYCYQGSTFFKSHKKKAANHVINLINHNGNIYGIDLYNSDILYQFKNEFIMESCAGFYSGKLRYKPYYEIMVGESDIDDMMDTVELFREEAKKRKISFLEYEENRYEVRKKIRGEEDKLDDFFDKTKVLKKEIVRSKKLV